MDSELTPALLNQKRNGKDAPETLCARCPEGVWMAGKTRLRCFCRVTRHLSYDNLSTDMTDPILDCDGYEEAMLDVGSKPSLTSEAEAPAQ